MPTRFLQTTAAPIAPLRGAAVAVAFAVLAGCASQPRAPVEDRVSAPPKPSASATTAVGAAGTPGAPAGGEADWRPQSYTVKRGDTLYQIALDHGLDYRELAAWNGIENVNLIRTGQVLRLTAPGEQAPSASGVTTAPLRTAPAVVEAKPGSGAAPAPSASRRAPPARSRAP